MHVLCPSVALSLREILDLEPLRRAGPEVLAGRSELDRAVRWVHVTELPDIAYLLSGGELLLTTGMGIAGSNDVQRRYVAELAAAGAAGVVVELGRNFDRLPDAMVEAAESVGLPLVALERETRFVEVTEAVHKEIINRQYELLRRAELVSRELTELILSGAGLDRIVGRLAEIFDNHVVLEDEAHQVVEIAGVSEGLGAVLARWDEHARRGHDELGRGTVHRCDGAPRCMWVALWLRHELWGRLHVLETRSRLDEITELLVDRAGAALSLALLSEKDAAHLADRARSALVGEVVAGRYGSTTELLRRARSLGADLERGRLVVLALELAGEPDRGSAGGPGRSGAGGPDRGSAGGPGRSGAGEPDRGSAGGPGRSGAGGPLGAEAAGLGGADAGGRAEAGGEEARRLAGRAAAADDLRQAAAERACGALVGGGGGRPPPHRGVPRGPAAPSSPSCRARAPGRSPRSSTT
jgi:purine catabolism regulator